MFSSNYEEKKAALLETLSLLGLHLLKKSKEKGRPYIFPASAMHQNLSGIEIYRRRRISPLKFQFLFQSFD